MKFNRKYRLTIELNDGGEAIIIEPPLTIDFNVSRGAFSQLNSMSLLIYNLSEKSRRRIFQDRYRLDVHRRIILEAGYGDSLTTLFIGTIYQAFTTRTGSEIITNITSRDGWFDVSQTRTDKTFAAGITFKELLQEMASDFSDITTGAIGGDDITFQRPVTVEGNTYNSINMLTRNNAFVDLQRLNVLQPSQVTDDPIFNITADTGLLDAPQREESYLTITTLFEPRIQMGQVVNLDSSVERAYNGQYKVIGATHTGMISEAMSGQLISKFNLLFNDQLFGRFQQVGTG